MEIANLTKQASAPPFRSDKVVLYAATDGYVYQRGTDGTFQLARQSEVTTALTAGLATKAATSHGHAIADTTGLQTALDAKEAVDAQRVQLGSVTATTSGTSIDFTGIPSGTRRITINFFGVSTNNTSDGLIQLGDAGGIETTGYLGTGTTLAATTMATSQYTAGFGIRALSAPVTLQGTVILTLLEAAAFTWACAGVLADGASAAGFTLAGSKSTSQELDRIRLTTAGGTAAFDAGKLNIAYER